MSEFPDWLPELLLFEDYDGCWQRYEDVVFSKFHTDFIQSSPVFQGLTVYVTKQLVKGKERGFWHCIQEGLVEEKRTPDFRRCERITWIKAIIENANDPKIKKWQKQKGRHIRQLLWLEEVEYLVILENRKTHWLLITAYCTTREHTKNKLRKEYESSLK